MSQSSELKTTSAKHASNTWPFIKALLPEQQQVSWELWKTHRPTASAFLTMLTSMNMVHFHITLLDLRPDEPGVYAFSDKPSLNQLWLKRKAPVKATVVLQSPYAYNFFMFDRKLKNGNLTVVITPRCNSVLWKIREDLFPPL